MKRQNSEIEKYTVYFSKNDNFQNKIEIIAFEVCKENYKQITNKLMKKKGIVSFLSVCQICGIKSSSCVSLDYCYEHYPPNIKTIFKHEISEDKIEDLFLELSLK